MKQYFANESTYFGLDKHVEPFYYVISAKEKQACMKHLSI